MAGQLHQREAKTQAAVLCKDSGQTCVAFQFCKTHAVRQHPAIHRSIVALALFAGLAGPLGAQNVLFAEYNGKYLPVVRARGTQPVVVADGKQVVADGRKLAMKKVGEYLPVFVTVRDMTVNTSVLDLSGARINNAMDLHAWLETPYWLDDVFIALELDTEGEGKLLMLHEVGRLEANEPKSLSIHLQLSVELGEGKYQMHLFAGGPEVFHSNIPPEYRDRAVDRMTEKRIAGVQEASPKPLIGPVPEYPATMLKTKSKGEAVIAVRVGTNGRAYDPVVKSASDPAFGESALVAVRLWRFLPRVKEGRAVESRVELPFKFNPPEKPAKQP